MARTESIASGGFFATPPDQVPRIAALLRIEEYPVETADKVRLSVLDPCAGEGTAIIDLVHLITRGHEDQLHRLEKVRMEEYRLREIERQARYKIEREKRLAEQKVWEARRKAEREEKEAFRRIRWEKKHGKPYPVDEPAEPVAEEEPPQEEEQAASPLGEATVEAEEPVVEEEPVAEEVEEETVEVKKMKPKSQEITCADFYAIEMERGRFNVLHESFDYNQRSNLLHGDAFCATWKEHPDAGTGLLFLNPPYDTNKGIGRPEERFLRRFTGALAPGGVLVFLVPHYVLEASAETFARSYEEVSCYRFAGDAFNVFKQVVVFARKLPKDRIEPDTAIRDMVNLWSDKGAECPELPDAGHPHRRDRYVVPMRDRHAHVLEDWKMRVVDVAALLQKYVPWHESTRRSGLQAVSRVVPSFSLVDCMHRTYEVATPPRPAHIAAGLAAGLFNGQRIEPDDPGTKLPPLLVKGVFDREWRTVEEKKDKHGEVKSVVQVQAPKLVITILDLHEHKYHTLGATLEESGSMTVASMGISDILKHYGKSLMGVMERQCDILYDPRYDGDSITLAESARPLYVAQEHTVKALVKLIRERPGEMPLLGAEIGCLRGDTPIHDPVTGDTVAVAERYRRAAPFHVWALSPQGDPVVAAAMPPVKYPIAQMVKVTMEDGSFVVVTPAHRFWNGKDWVKASDAASEIAEQQGFALYHLPTSSDSDLRVRARDASRWSRTIPGSQDGCHRGRCSYGEQLPSVQGSDQGSVPLQDDVREHNPGCLHEGDQVSGLERNHSCQSSVRHSTTDFEVRKEDLHLELFLPPPGSRPSNEKDLNQVLPRSRQGFCPARTTFGRALGDQESMSVLGDESRSRHQQHESSPHTSEGRFQVPSMSGGDFSRLRTEDELASGVRGSIEPSQFTSLDGVNYNLFVEKSKQVISVEPVDAENYYDFHVPVFNNYWAVGLWHHNSGKSAISLITAKTLKAKRILIICPPHLLDSWRNETKVVLPEAEYRVLDTISSVEALAEIPADKMLVAVVSRETAKLGHRREGVSVICPACGEPTTDNQEGLAKKRARCGSHAVIPVDTLAQVARETAIRLMPWWREVALATYLPARLRSGFVNDRQKRVGMKGADKAPVYTSLPTDVFTRVIDDLTKDYRPTYSDTPVKKALLWTVLAEGASPQFVLTVAAKLKPEYADSNHFAESFLLLLPQGAWLAKAFELLETFPRPSSGYHGMEESTATCWFKTTYAAIEGEKERKKADIAGFAVTRDDEGVMAESVKPGSLEAVDRFLTAVGQLGTWKRGPECGEHLYQAVPEPRRYPLAKYIVRRHKNTFDFFIADEIQEYANDSSAQTIAAHRLVALRKPMIFMTGTILNGYAKSVFPTMTAISSDFRREFDRGDLQMFVDRYGYRKRILSDKEDGEVVAYGTQSDRVERSERDAGDAPGVLPLFLFRHLLKSTVTLHKADLRINIPPLTQDRDVIACTSEVQAEYARILGVLKKQIKADQFKPGRAGRLFGQLSEFQSFPDVCTEDVGNVEGGGAFEIRYPENMEECGGQLVASAKMLPASTILPKEAKMIAFVKGEVAAGRNVMVLGWHLRLLPRLARLLSEALGEIVPILYADKVSTAKRQAWIEKEIVGKKRRCLCVNPVCIQTGLNSLVHFSSQWWHESPACNPLTFRQAVGRIDRIGQTKPTKTLFGYYGETLQEKMYDLLMAKVGISTAVDGLDPSMAWAAAGIVEDENLLGLSLGKALWEMMTKDDDSNVISISRARRARSA